VEQAVLAAACVVNGPETVAPVDLRVQNHCDGPGFVVEVGALVLVVGVPTVVVTVTGFAIGIAANQCESAGTPIASATSATSERRIIARMLR
jgi:hypothetical protein